MELLFMSFGALISVINPLGTLPIFISLMKDKERKEINETAIRTVLNVFVIMIIAFFLGQYVLGFFSISLEALKITGGLIITSSGFALLSGKFTKHKGMRHKEKADARSRSDVSLTPLALPMLSGPGSISLLITYNQTLKSNLEWLTIIGAILLTCFATLMLLLSARIIVRSLGASGINALSRIVGFIVIAIGVQYIISALFVLVAQLK
ncbi:MAG: MarC family protein [Fluviicola sp.]